jgi:hypothetical protein
MSATQGVASIQIAKYSMANCQIPHQHTNYMLHDCFLQPLFLNTRRFLSSIELPKCLLYLGTEAIVNSGY